MLVPQFSIRQILAVVTALSVFSLVASLAIRGQVWALAVVIAGLTLALAFVLYGLCFFAAWCISRFRPARPALPQSPFAPDTLPPQMIPPEEPPA
jgi:hypothetical protein